ncbi:alcohol dehydrogenase class-3-like [Mytilus californianus]|uniref:alcohol dehydrogenase class-3-like n=1 Tax=Mytilus californianus TaxID=6549 RepID=UPI002246F95B|nr:alcohol dehydrogenase class-3-like [Mytilus californianus]
MSETRGKIIQCKAAVCWEPRQPLSIETVEVEPPRGGEVRVRIAFTGICHSDAHILNGCIEAKLPVILGHEAAGVVESVGEGVTNFQEGDHVIAMFLPECNQCRCCTSGKTGTCEVFMDKNYANGLLMDGTSRFSIRGKTVYHFFDTSTFSQYTVIPAISLVKVNPVAPLEKICLLGCGIPTGYGTAVNTAPVKQGSVCAVWGLGCIGLACVMGCKAAGAARVIGVDINADKFELSKKFGVTEAVNPLDYDKPINEVLKEKTNGGLDFAFECVGTTKTMEQAFMSLHKGWGKLCVVGLAPDGDIIKVPPFELLYGRSITGALYGDHRRAKQVPELVNKYMRGEILIDEFITHTMPLDRINEAFDLQRDGKSLRSVVTM